MSEHSDDVVEDVSGVMMNGAAAAARAVEAVARRRQGDSQQRTQETRERTDELQRRYEAQATAAERFYADRARLDALATATPAEAATLWHGTRVWAELEPERFTRYADAVDRALTERLGTSPREYLAREEVPVNQAQPVVESLIDTRDREQAAARSDEHADLAAEHRDHADEDLHEAASPDASAADRDAARARADSELDAADVDQAEAEHWAADPGDPAQEISYDSAERRTATEETLRTAGVSDQAIAARMTSDRLNGQHPHTAAASSKKSTTKRRPRAKVHTSQKVRDSGLER